MKTQKIPKGYKKTKIGIIPTDWEVKKLEEIGAILNGLTYSPDNISENGVLVLRSSNIQDRMLIYDDNVYVDVENLNYNRVKTTDILICVRNGSKNLIGKNAIIKDKDSGVAFGAFMTIYRSKLNDYIFQFFGTELYKRQVHRNLGATINSINNNDLRKFLLPLPPKTEQENIAKVLITWDKAIEKLSALITAKKQQKKALMQSIFNGQLKIANEKWTETKLGEVFKERNETGLVDLELLSIGEEGVYPQSLSNKKDTSNDDKSKYKRICIGDIGYNTMRLWQGRCALSNLEGIVSPAYTILTPNKKHNAEFFSYLFKMSFVIHNFFRYSQGMVSDTLSCKYKEFKKIKLKIPPLSVQEKIANILSTADKEIAILEKKLATYKEQKKGLMQVLLTGKVRIMN